VRDTDYCKDRKDFLEDRNKIEIKLGIEKEIVK
jgi:hypothetical protein